MKHIPALVLTILLSLINADNVFCQANKDLIKTLKAQYAYNNRPAGVEYDEEIDCYEIRMYTDDLFNAAYALCDNTGKELIPPKYDIIYGFYLKDYPFCGVKKGEKEGIYSIEKGKEIVPTRFDEIRIDYVYQRRAISAASPRFHVRSNNKWGLYDSLGSEIIPIKYDSISGINGDEYKVMSDDKWTIYDIKSGKEIFPLKFNDVSRLGNNQTLASYKIDGKCGLLSFEKQQELTEAKYVDLQKYGNFILSIEDDKQGLLDNNGKELIPTKYSDIVLVGDSVAIIIDGITFAENHDIIRNGKWGAYDLRKCEMIVPPRYDYISREITENIIRCNIGGNPIDLMAIKGGKWGCIDFDGNEVIPFDYETIGRFDKGVAQVKINGAIGLIENPLSGTALQLAVSKNSPVDINIPTISKVNNETFVFIIANENYQKFDASYSIRDGETMAKYCEKRLGVPKKNITIYDDATYGVMQSMLTHCYDIADVYEGDASFIIYFSGIGFMELSEKDCFILPVDASITNVKSTALSIKELLAQFSNLNVNNLMLITDCPFNGVDRTGNSLTKDGRGVAIRQDIPISGSEVTWISSSQSTRQKTIDKDTQHGILTYSILDVLQKERNVSLSELIDKVNKHVKEKTFELNGEVAAPSIKINESKKDLKL